MYKVYVLKSQKDGKRYTGFSIDIKRRLKEHNRGKVGSTSRRGPLKLIYYENYQTELEAKKREIFLKSGQGRKFLDMLPPAQGGR